MLKFFYNLYFQYTTAENQRSELNIGYFSTYKKARSVIETYKSLPGFKNYSVDNFKIQKFGVRCRENGKKSGKPLYQLSFEEDITVFESEWIIFGMYDSYKAARLAQRFYENKRKYKDHPERFTIAKWIVDKNKEWSFGFSE